MILGFNLHNGTTMLKAAGFDATKCLQQNPDLETINRQMCAQHGSNFLTFTVWIHHVDSLLLVDTCWHRDKLTSHGPRLNPSTVKLQKCSQLEQLRAFVCCGSDATTSNKACQMTKLWGFIALWITLPQQNHCRKGNLKRHIIGGNLCVASYASRFCCLHHSWMDISGTIHTIWIRSFSGRVALVFDSPSHLLDLICHVENRWQQTCPCSRTLPPALLGLIVLATPGQTQKCSNFSCFGNLWKQVSFDSSVFLSYPVPWIAPHCVSVVVGRTRQLHGHVPRLNIHHIHTTISTIVRQRLRPHDVRATAVIGPQTYFPPT